MRLLLLILLFLRAAPLVAHNDTEPDFVWGNSSYYNLYVGDSIRFNGTWVRLLGIHNNRNDLKIGVDTLRLNVAQRSLPVAEQGISIFVADNSAVAALTCDTSIHGLLSKDALLCLSPEGESRLDYKRFIFPVSFNHGFVWSGEEDSYMFSLTRSDATQSYTPFAGIGVDLRDARGKKKHWLVALEDCKVEWIEPNSDPAAVCVLLSSSVNPGIYYVYDGLYKKNLDIRKGQKLQRGELVGTAWGDANWGYFQLAVVFSDKPPVYENRYTNVVNCFPQLYELYYQHSLSLSRTFTKGKIEFGRDPVFCGNVQNASGFEQYLGKGWLLDTWNTAGKVEWVARGDSGNVRLSKTLFAGTKAQCTNPLPFYDYTIAVKNGTYRIRAKVGDIDQASWQKISFENVEAGTFALRAGQQTWTGEKVVRVSDFRLHVRIYVSPDSNSVAGLSEIVFQQAY